MYLPNAFREDRLDVLHGLIGDRPLGLLVTSGADELVADPLPFVLDPNAGEFGTLKAHISRANPHCATLATAKQCLVAFGGPDAYISPSWYATKAEAGRVAPTWNYVMVHVWGQPHLIEDEGWLRSQLDALASMQERLRPSPWAVSDAPEDYVAGLLKGIVGLEIPIDRIEGKWKASQNRPEADRAGVVEGLLTEGNTVMAEIVCERGGKVA